MKNKKNVRVAIIAIAKDEAAYLPDWVHHHLYFGFDGIFIGINRTTDLSLRVLEEIKKKYNNVFFQSVDWIDQATNESINTEMQSIAYAFLTNFAKKENSYTHFLYIDIDEFWFPLDFTSNINSYISKFKKIDMVSFNWLMQYGDSKPFMRPFDNLYCEPRRQVKSLIARNITEKITKYRCHIPLLEIKQNEYIHVDATGCDFVEGEKLQVSKRIPDKNFDAFILHRAYKSEKEYVALLVRNNPDSNITIKNNRQSGYRESKKFKEPTVFIDLSKRIMYWKSLSKFKSQCNLDVLIRISKDKIMRKNKHILDIDEDKIITNGKAYALALSGTHLKQRLDEIILKSNTLPLDIKSFDIFNNPEKYINLFEFSEIDVHIYNELLKSKSEINNQTDTLPFLRCAIFYEKRKKYSMAINYIDFALSIRPSGNLLLEKRQLLLNKQKEKESVIQEKSLVSS